MIQKKITLDFGYYDYNSTACQPCLLMTFVLLSERRHILEMSSLDDCTTNYRVAVNISLPNYDEWSHTLVFPSYTVFFSFLNNEWLHQIMRPTNQVPWLCSPYVSTQYIHTYTLYTRTIIKGKHDWLLWKQFSHNTKITCAIGTIRVKTQFWIAPIYHSTQWVQNVYEVENEFLILTKN